MEDSELSDTGRAWTSVSFLSHETAGKNKDIPEPSTRAIVDSFWFPLRGGDIVRGREVGEEWGGVELVVEEVGGVREVGCKK